MRYPIFIRLENSLDAAMRYENSPQMTEYSFEGVQLLPNHPFPYIQRTYAKQGIEIEEWTVLVKDLYGNTLEDITDYFDVLRAFDDPDTGLPQVEWEIKKEFPFDFGYQNIYLEIEVGANGFVYSTPFMITDYKSEYVTRWDYRNDDEETMLSSSLRMYFRQRKSQQEISNYPSVATGKTFTYTSKLTKYERWNTDVIEINFIEKIKELFLCRYRYSMGLNDDFPVRTGLFEAFDSPDLEADENFAEAEINLLRDYNITYDPNYIPPTPPDPPVDPPTITLIKVENERKQYLTYTFTTQFFSPTYLTYQYSPDGVVWTSATSDPNSPHDVYIGNLNVTGYYFRIVHESGVESNIVQLAVPSIVIDNITSPQSSFNSGGNNYFIYYTLNGFTPYTQLSFQARVNSGQPWQPLYYSVGYQNPKAVQTPSSGTEFIQFRVLYSTLGITSEPFDFEF